MYSLVSLCISRMTLIFKKDVKLHVNQLHGTVVLFLLAAWEYVNLLCCCAWLCFISAVFPTRGQISVTWCVFKTCHSRGECLIAYIYPLSCKAKYVGSVSGMYLTQTLNIPLSQAAVSLLLLVSRGVFLHELFKHAIFKYMQDGMQDLEWNC